MEDGPERLEVGGPFADPRRLRPEAGPVSLCLAENDAANEVHAPMITTLALLLTLAAPADDPQMAAVDHISADSLKGHLSFLASDLLEGRDTPSRGLDLAAAYIASQFRRAGLEPIGDDGYFQTARWLAVEPDPAGVSLSLKIGDETISAAGTG